MWGWPDSWLDLNNLAVHLADDARSTATDADAVAATADATGRRTMCAMLLLLATRRTALLSGGAALSAITLLPVSPAVGEAPVFPVLAARASVSKLLEEEETYRTMVTIGLATGNLQMPPLLSFKLFQQLEPSVTDPGTFMDAAIEYVEYARDANDLTELARLSRTNGGDPGAVQDYLDRSLIAAKGAAKALDRMVPLLPAR